jgi:DNA modification methylase
MRLEYKIGDCLELMKDIPDKSIDLVLTDVPYNEVNRSSNGLRNLNKGVADSSIFDMDELFDELIRVCKGSFYIFCGFQQFSYIDGLMRKHDISTRCIIWKKTNPSPMNCKHIWVSGVELCVFGKKKKATYNYGYQNTVLEYPCGSSKLHPTQKPVELFKELILKSTHEGDLILDPFLGSGTTLLACKQLNRNCIGFEKQPEYEPIIRKRAMLDTPNLNEFEQ